MVLYYNDGNHGFDYEYDITNSEFLDALENIIKDGMRISKNEAEVIRRFVYNHELEDTMYDWYEDEIRNYFYHEAYAKYKDDCADDEYWKNTDIHGGV